MRDDHADRFPTQDDCEGLEAVEDTLGLNAAVVPLVDGAELPAYALAAAAGALERSDPTVRNRVAAIDPSLVITLARLVAQIVLACTSDKAAAVVARVKERPRGIVANRLRRRLVAKMPDSLGRDREDLATSLMNQATEHLDDRDAWNAAFGG